MSEDRMADLGLGGSPGEVVVHVDDGGGGGERKGKKGKKGKKGSTAAPSAVEMDAKDEAKVVVGDEAKIFDGVNKAIAVIKRQTATLNKLDLNPVNQEGMDALTQSINQCMQRATEAGTAGKRQLDQIKADLTKGGDGASQARANLYNNACKEFQSAMSEYNTLFQRIKETSNENKKRQLRNLPGDVALGDDQIDAIIASGKEGEVMQKAMLMEDLSQLQDIVADVEERHAEILRLEKSVLELLELFKDLSMLVDIQGEQLGRIDVNIAKAKDNTKKAVDALGKAEKGQIAARKKQCYLCMCMLVIVVVALAIGGFFSGIFGSS